MLSHTITDGAKEALTKVRLVGFRSEEFWRADPEYRGLALGGVFPSMRHFGLVLGAIPFAQKKVPALQSQRNLTGKDVYQLLACARGYLRSLLAGRHPDQNRLHLVVTVDVCQSGKGTS